MRLIFNIFIWKRDNDFNDNIQYLRQMNGKKKFVGICKKCKDKGIQDSEQSFSKHSINKKHKKVMKFSKFQENYLLQPYACSKSLSEVRKKIKAETQKMIDYIREEEKKVLQSLFPLFCSTVHEQKFRDQQFEGLMKIIIQDEKKKKKKEDSSSSDSDNEEDEDDQDEEDVSRLEDLTCSDFHYLTSNFNQDIERKEIQNALNANYNDYIKNISEFVAEKVKFNGLSELQISEIEIKQEQNHEDQDQDQDQEEEDSDEDHSVSFYSQVKQKEHKKEQPFSKKPERILQESSFEQKKPQQQQQIRKVQTFQKKKSNDAFFKGMKLITIKKIMENRSHFKEETTYAVKVRVLQQVMFKNEKIFKNRADKTSMCKFIGGDQTGIIICYVQYDRFVSPGETILLKKFLVNDPYYEGSSEILSEDIEWIEQYEHQIEDREVNRANPFSEIYFNPEMQQERNLEYHTEYLNKKWKTIRGAITCENWKDETKPYLKDQFFIVQVVDIYFPNWDDKVFEIIIADQSCEISATIKFKEVHSESQFEKLIKIGDVLELQYVLVQQRKPQDCPLIIQIINPVPYTPGTLKKLFNYKFDHLGKEKAVQIYQKTFKKPLQMY